MLGSLCLTVLCRFDRVDVFRSSWGSSSHSLSVRSWSPRSRLALCPALPDCTELSLHLPEVHRDSWTVSPCRLKSPDRLSSLSLEFQPIGGLLHRFLQVVTELRLVTPMSDNISNQVSITFFQLRSSSGSLRLTVWFRLMIVDFDSLIFLCAARALLVRSGLRDQICFHRISPFGLIGGLVGDQKWAVAGGSSSGSCWLDRLAFALALFAGALSSAQLNSTLLVTERRWREDEEKKLVNRKALWFIQRTKTASSQEQVCLWCGAPLSVGALHDQLWTIQRECDFLFDRSELCQQTTSHL